MVLGLVFVVLFCGCTSKEEGTKLYKCPNGQFSDSPSNCPKEASTTMESTSTMDETTTIVDPRIKELEDRVEELEEQLKAVKDTTTTSSTTTSTTTASTTTTIEYPVSTDMVLGERTDIRGGGWHYFLGYEIQFESIVYSGKYTPAGVHLTVRLPDGTIDNGFIMVHSNKGDIGGSTTVRGASIELLDIISTRRGEEEVEIRFTVNEPPITTTVPEGVRSICPDGYHSVEDRRTCPTIIVHEPEE